MIKIFVKYCDSRTIEEYLLLFMIVQVVVNKDNGQKCLSPRYSYLQVKYSSGAYFLKTSDSLPQNEGVMPGAGSSVKKCGNPQGEEAIGLQAEGKTSVGMLYEQRVTGQDANDLSNKQASQKSGAKAQSILTSFIKESVRTINSIPEKESCGSNVRVLTKG